MSWETGKWAPSTSCHMVKNWEEWLIHTRQLCRPGSPQTRETDRGQPHEIQQGICKVLHLVRKNPAHQYKKEDHHLESNWQKKTWVSWWIRSWIWSAISLCDKGSQQNAWVHQLEPCQRYWALVRHIWSTVSCSGQRDVNELECVQ